HQTDHGQKPDAEEPTRCPEGPGRRYVQSDPGWSAGSQGQIAGDEARQASSRSQDIEPAVAPLAFECAHGRISRADSEAESGAERKGRQNDAHEGTGCS